MAQQILNNQESAQVFRGKLNDNFTDLYTNKAATNHSSSNTGFGVASNTLYGHVKVTPGNGLVNNGGALSMSLGSTSAAGAVQLANSISSTATNRAATANSVKMAVDAGVKTYYGTEVPASSLGKVGDIYIKIS